MAQKHLGMIEELKENILAVSGEDAAGKVMEGAENLKESTSNVALADWIKGAMDRLDATVPKEQSEKIMAACGRNCAKINHRAISNFQKRRAKFSSLEDFLKAESQSPMKGTKLILEGQNIIQVYCPSEFSHPMRCYCSLVNNLPMNETLSPTYCQCSRAFVQQMWEEALEQQVSVTVLKSALCGATECHFRIDLKK